MRKSGSARFARPSRGATTFSTSTSRRSSVGSACSSAARRCRRSKPCARRTSRTSSPLASKSLVRHGSSPDGDEPRYFMLETIREFAAEELVASGELELLQERHAGWFEDLARSFVLPESAERLVRFELDLANLRAAFSWAEESEARWPAAIALALAARDSPLPPRALRRGRGRRAPSARSRPRAARRSHASTIGSASCFGFRVDPREALDEYGVGRTSPRRHHDARCSLVGSVARPEAQPGRLLLLRERAVGARASHCASSSRHRGARDTEPESRAASRARAAPRTASSATHSPRRRRPSRARCT